MWRRILGPVFSLLYAGYAAAWNDTGHMVVAAIAEAKLTPKAKAAADELLKVGATERAYSFITAGPWADDIRSDKDRPWHYINIHFWEDGSASSNKPEKQNVVWAIRTQTAILKSRSSSRAAKADALRYLIHFVGDIHQPFHCLSRDSDDFPQGDRGGNSHTIQPISGWGDRDVTNLHALWDFGLGEFLPSRRPLSAENATRIYDIAKKYMVETPQLASVVKVTDPMIWANESFGLRMEVYNIGINAPVNEPYLNNGRRIVRIRTAKAGYRLAALLNSVFR